MPSNLALAPTLLKIDLAFADHGAMPSHEFYRSYLRVMTFIFRVVGWFMLVGGAVMAVLSFAATEDRAIAIGAAVATTLVGLALIKSKPLILENMLGFDMLGREK